MRDNTRPTTDLFGQTENLHAAIDLLIQSFDNGGKLLICGNGGSAADCEHIVGELMKGFCLPRRLSANDRARFGDSDGAAIADQLQYGLPAISLVSHSALITAIANDIAGDMIFAQQVWGIGRDGDVLLAISTSGQSANVINAAKTARARGLGVIGLTGQSGGALRALCDVVITVPSNDVALIQEMHLPIYHALCRQVEAHYFGD